jgi:hypothetical protein
MNSALLEEISPYLRLRISTRARRMALRLDPGERAINLVVPKRANMRAAYKFAEDHKEWINRKIIELPAPVPFEEGIILPIKGIDHKVKVNHDFNLRRTYIELKNNNIIVSTNQTEPAPRIKRYLRNLSKEYIFPLAEEKAKSLGKQPCGINIRDTKSRWGSCSNEGRLSFSWRLIFAPPEAMDYVIAHEVAHLVHMNHSKAFWNTCRSLCEDYMEGRYWMRNHGQELLRYGQQHLSGTQ